MAARVCKVVAARCILSEKKSCQPTTTVARIVATSPLYAASPSAMTTAFVPCGAQARRTLSLPALSLMASSSRAAHQVNERAAHAPQRSGEYKHRHGPGCGCGSASAPMAPSGVKGAFGGRPWMISH